MIKSKKRKRDDYTPCNIIPLDIIGEITSFLRPPDRIKFFMVSRTYYDFYKNNKQRLYENKVMEIRKIPNILFSDLNIDLFQEEQKLSF